MSESQRQTLKEQDKKQSLLENDNITASIIMISLPMMVTGFVDALYNMVDSIFVGRFIGDKALAALAVNNSIQVTLMALATLYGSGMTSIIARALGAQNHPKVKDTIINGTFLCVVSTLIFSFVILINLDTILKFMGSSEDVLQYSRQYGSVILWFGFLVPVNGVMSGILRASGDVKIIMWLALLGATTNIVLDALFIIVFQWGVAGAAWATIFAQMLVAYFLIRSISRVYQLHFEFHYLKRMSKSLVFEIYNIGISNSLRVLTFAIMGISANRTLALYGATAVASFGVINRILHLAYQPIFGSNLGTQTLIGYNYGANRFLKVKNIIIKGITLATIVSLLPSLILLWAPERLFQLFTQSDEIIAYAQDAARMAGLTFYLYGFQIFSTGALLAMGHPKEALFLSIFRPIVMVINMNVLPQFFQISGVWYTFPTTDIISSLVTLIIITRELTLLKKREDQHKQLMLH